MEELLPRNREWKNCCPGPPHAPGNMAFPHTPAFIPGHHHPDLGHLMASLPTAGNTDLLSPSHLPCLPPARDIQGCPHTGSRNQGYPKPVPAFKVLHSRTMTNGQYSQNLPPQNGSTSGFKLTTLHSLCHVHKEAYQVPPKGIIRFHAGQEPKPSHSA